MEDDDEKYVIDSTKPTVLEPMRVAVFNDGAYMARLKVNFIQDDLQEEIVLDDDIGMGTERSIFVPATASYLWIRVHIVGDDGEQQLVDRQMIEVKQSSAQCYLLAGDLVRPLYGLCPGTYWDMLKTWEA